MTFCIFCLLNESPSLTAECEHCHFTKRSYDFFTDVFFFQLFLQNLEEKQCNEAVKKMCFYLLHAHSLFEFTLKPKRLFAKIFKK